MICEESCTRPFFQVEKTYLLRSSYVKRVVDDITFRAYGITKILDNTFDAIISRIKFIQKCQTSNFCGGVVFCDLSNYSSCKCP